MFLGYWFMSSVIVTVDYIEHPVSTSLFITTLVLFTVMMMTTFSGRKLQVTGSHY